MSKELNAVHNDILAFLKMYANELNFDPGSRLLSSAEDVAQYANVSDLINRLEAIIGKKETYYVLIEPLSNNDCTEFYRQLLGVFVKTGKLFEEQKGLTAEWGKKWVKTEARSVKEARNWGYDQRRRESK